jgi:large subunit ribosomal protein L30
MNGETKRLRVTLIRSRYGRLESHRACIRGLGLRKMHQTVEVEDTPCTRGMIDRVSYLLRVEEVSRMGDAACD